MSHVKQILTDLAALVATYPLAADVLTKVMWVPDVELENWKGGIIIAPESSAVEIVSRGCRKHTTIVTIAVLHPLSSARADDMANTTVDSHHALSEQIASSLLGSRLTYQGAVCTAVERVFAANHWREYRLFGDFTRATIEHHTTGS